jgi:predicted nucleic acid-binding protein
VDAGCLTLHFLADPRIRRFFDDIEDGTRPGYASSVNLSEFYYKTCQKLGKPTADLRYVQIRRTRLKVVETDEELTRAAGLEKCRQPQKLSLADCHALSLAKRFRATLLTTDKELARAKGITSLLFEV